MSSSSSCPGPNYAPNEPPLTIQSALLSDFLNENYELYPQSPDAGSSYSESSECSSEEVDPDGSNAPTISVTTTSSSAIVATSTNPTGAPQDVGTHATVAYPSTLFAPTEYSSGSSSSSAHSNHSMHSYGHLSSGPVVYHSHATSTIEQQQRYFVNSSQAVVDGNVNESSASHHLSFNAPPAPLYSHSEFSYRSSSAIYSNVSYCPTADSTITSSTPSSSTVTVSATASLPIDTLSITSLTAPSKLSIISNDHCSPITVQLVSGCAISPHLHTQSTLDRSNRSESESETETQHYTDLSSSIASSKSTDAINGLLTSNELNSLSPVLVASDDPHSSGSNSQDSSSSASIGSNHNLSDNLPGSGESSQPELATQEDNFGEIIKSSIVESVTA